MHNKDKVLVVGTTSDYIDWIRQANPGRALFLTDPYVRNAAYEADPLPEEEILCFLDDVEQVQKGLLEHLAQWQLSVNGIVCFDCESMELAAILARKLSLSYPSVECIHLCRDKYESKAIWQKSSVPCPQAQIVQSADGVFDFLQQIDGPCVLKPLTGSGSELVFLCASRKDCDKGVKLIQEGLRARKSNRLYESTSWFLVEECVHGPEYSCDFQIRHNKIEIIRRTKKIKLNNKPFGTIDGYVLTDKETTDGIDEILLRQTLLRGAIALGISDAVCMVDFLLRDKEIVLLEMTPRPGGDCLPFLLKRSQSLDILTYSLDFAQQRDTVPARGKNGSYAALRIHASEAGTIQKIDSHFLQQDPRVAEVHSIRKPGHRINMPPQDYDSWYLGHLIFKPLPGVEVEAQAQELTKMYMVEIENDDVYYK